MVSRVGLLAEKLWVRFLPPQILFRKLSVLQLFGSNALKKRVLVLAVLPEFSLKLARDKNCLD